MPVFRVDKSRDFTVVANCIFKDRSLSAKAKGILVEMLSLPESWDFTLKGLTTLFTDGIDSIRQGINELEARGYIVRERKRDARGRLGGMEYVIYETPHKAVENSPESAEPITEEPTAENPTQESSTKEMPTTYKELSKSITNASITQESSTYSFLPEVSENFEDCVPVEKSGRKEVTDTLKARAEIKKQIDYDILVQRCQPSQLNELVEIMLEVKMNLSPNTRFSRDEVYPTVYVQDRYSRLNAEHIEQVLDGIRENTSKVLHTKAYLMKCLFNAPETFENKVAMDVNHDLYGERPANKSQ